MTGAESAAVALMATCGFCWARPGVACGEEGVHLARYVRAYRRGLLGQKELAVICETMAHVSAGHVITEVPTPPT